MGVIAYENKDYYWQRIAIGSIWRQRLLLWTKNMGSTYRPTKTVHYNMLWIYVLFSYRKLK